jgi:hypothetical protein
MVVVTVTVTVAHFIDLMLHLMDCPHLLFLQLFVHLHPLVVLLVVQGVLH